LKRKRNTAKPKESLLARLEAANNEACEINEKSVSAKTKNIKGGTLTMEERDGISAISSLRGI